MLVKLDVHVLNLNVHYFCLIFNVYVLVVDPNVKLFNIKE